MKEKSFLIRVAVPSPLRSSFDYWAPEGCRPEDLCPGIRIKVPFRKQDKLGILLEVAPTPQVATDKIKTAIGLLDEQPIIPEKIMRLATWAAAYYQYPIGEVLLGFLPAGLRQGRPVPTVKIPPIIANPCSTSLVLNPAQQAALSSIQEATGFKPFLLDGITGSGKTEVYLQAIEFILQQQRQALVLVPEIGLTPQTIARFAERFAVPLAVFHSGLTEKERLNAWTLASTGQAPIVIGTRSAIFTPLKNPGIIILDEEHDGSYKQASGFRYSARDLALMRAQLEQIPIILGSATPSLETLANAKRNRYLHLQLPARAGEALMPHWHLIDVRNKPLDEGLSPALLTAMQQHLTANGQVLLFLNRRGFAPTLLCHHCGWTSQCRRCDAKLTLHQMPAALICHHCLQNYAVPSQCGQCGSSELLRLGLGTERLETALVRNFPAYKTVRIDRDTTRRKGSLQQLLQEIQSGDGQILLGTQMLTKGHHFPNITLVGIIDADSSLFSSDFRATERLGQLLIQVAGRAGRAQKPGEVYIQTHHPDNPLLHTLLHQGYAKFADELLTERRHAELPPYAYMAIIRAEAVTAHTPIQFLQQIKTQAQQIAMNTVQYYGPVPAVIARKAGRYRAQLVFQAKQRQVLQKLLSELMIAISKISNKTTVRWSIDVDPLEVI